MEKIFFFVSNSKAWKETAKFHENFFLDHNAFLYGLIIAIVVALVMAAIFYFGCCNSKKSNAQANMGVWAGFLIVTGVLVFLAADFSLIGKSGTKNTKSVFYKYSFYNANEKYLVLKTRNNQNQLECQQYQQDKDKIETELNRGGDVRYSFSIGCAVYSLIFFYIFSLLMKGFTYQGVAIPHLWPQKN